MGEYYHLMERMNAMRRTLLSVVAMTGLACFGGLVLPLGSGQGQDRNEMGTNLEKKQYSPPLAPKPIRIRESKPVEVNEAKFVVVAEAEWKCGKGDRDTPIDIQLHVTNMAKTEVTFNTFDWFGISVKKADGTLVNRLSAGRDITVLTRPLLIKPGACYAICRRAELHWDPNAKMTQMCYWDGTGRWAVYGPIEPGTFHLRFWYGAIWTKDAEKEAKVGTVPVWRGTVTTNDVVITVSAR